MRWAKKIGDIDREIGRLATICNVRILDPGVIERVLRNDASACGTSNPRAFDKMRSLVMMHYSVRDDVLDAMGSAQTVALMEQIVAKLREKFGEKMGGPA